jgi:hypothetical protein
MCQSTCHVSHEVQEGWNHIFFLHQHVPSTQHGVKYAINTKLVGWLIEKWKEQILEKAHVFLEGTMILNDSI